MKFLKKINFQKISIIPYIKNIKIQKYSMKREILERFSKKRTNFRKKNLSKTNFRKIK